MLTYKPNIKRHNRKSNDLKTTASKELDKIGQKLIDLSENWTQLKQIMRVLRMNK
jgi:hypothetical protein